MNRIQRLQAAINDILELKFRDDDTLLAKTLPEKLQQIHSLMEFSMVNNKDFHVYLGLFQNDILLDIQRCHEALKTMEEKQAVFNLLQLHASTRLKAVEFAFAYYLKSKSILFSDEKDQNSMANGKIKSTQSSYLHHWFFQTQKQKSMMVKTGS